MRVKLLRDDIVDEVCKNYTYEFREYIEFTKHILDYEVLPKDFNIGLIVGSSGSGKSVLLTDLCNNKSINPSEPIWDKSKAVCSHFKDYKDAEERLVGVGLNSIPSWLKPYNTLSNGQQYRVNLARVLDSNIVVDEFTSVIDRPTSLGLSNSVQRLIRDKNYKNIVFASVHKDIIPYLQPDWVYDTDEKTLTINSSIYNISNMEKVEFTKINHFMEV